MLQKYTEKVWNLANIQNIYSANQLTKTSRRKNKDAHEKDFNDTKGQKDINRI